MGAKGLRELPLDLMRGRARFQAWRKRRKPGVRIPRSLWALAVGIAKQHGSNRTALALGLDRRYLLRRIATTDALALGHASNPAFVELPPANLAGKECRLELDNGAGATMRVQFIGYNAADIEALSRGFWNGR